MSEVAARMEWGWIEFVALWLLTPLVFVVASSSFIRYWRGRRHK
jgi:hypothetical protein